MPTACAIRLAAALTLVFAVCCLHAVLSRDAAAQPFLATEFFATRSVTLDNGQILEETIINGPPTPPPGFIRATASLPVPFEQAGINSIADVPAFTWCFGCSATSAAMIAGYYDRHGYPNMYTGPSNGGVMPLNNDAYWSPWYDSSGALRYRCPLSATQQGLDGREIRGHVDDYWIKYGNAGPDPFVLNGWAEHEKADCTADFMCTNKMYSSEANEDGGTTFYIDLYGSRTSAAALESLGYGESSGLCGIKRFYESRGYEVVEAYNQFIDGYRPDGYPVITGGFTFEDYKAEIDAGHPTMFHVEGHTMVGIGYDDAGQAMYIHDTWDHSDHEMTWGGSYGGMSMYAVTVVVLAPAPPMALSPAVPGLLLQDTE